MKHCPECNRNYADPTLSFCLRDGARLIYGEAIGEPETAVLATDNSSENETKSFVQVPNSVNGSSDRATPSPSKRNRIIAGVIGIILVTGLGVLGYLYFGRASSKRIASMAGEGSRRAIISYVRIEDRSEVGRIARRPALC